MGKYTEIVTDEQKLKWVEEYVETQQQELQQARHQILLLRQNTLREYSDHIVVSLEFSKFGEFAACLTITFLFRPWIQLCAK